MAKKRKPAKRKPAMTEALVGEKLDPPMTKKERQQIQKYRAILLAGVGFAQMSADPGVANMALNEPYLFDLHVNDRVQAYRDGKE